jgi:hypothetical protein
LVIAMVLSALGGACVVQASPTGGKKGGTGGGEPNATASGLPCDVTDVVDASCTSCHSDPPQNGAPNALLSYDDFMAPSKTNPSITMAEASLQRMKDAASPMPPQGAPADQIAVMQKWVDAGMPQGTCDTTNPPPDMAFSGSLTCTSGKTWSSGKGASMDPGMHCNKCHNIPFAGTVYPTGHEPDRCYGINGSTMSDVKVRLTGADGHSVEVGVGPTGNFYLTSSLKKPYTAAVVSSKGERVMQTPQTNGDCNLCHTALAGGNGSTSPGRIVVPY